MKARSLIILAGSTYNTEAEKLQPGKSSLNYDFGDFAALDKNNMYFGITMKNLFYGLLTCYLLQRRRLPI
ncbi:MAG: hypothetical protein ACLR2G_00910 [Phascolarctobacterium faecium]